MNWKRIILIVALQVFVTEGFAQSNLLNAKTPDQIGKKTEADMIAEMTIRFLMVTCMTVIFY